MKPKYKWLILFFCLVCSLIGFMIKLPRVFRGNDRFLHTVFYFLAAGFIHILFPRRLPVILICLVLFGVAIEYLQEYSNKLLRRRIHGRFDPEDIRANLWGLAAYLPFGVVVWAYARLRTSRKLAEPPGKDQ